MIGNYKPVEFKQCNDSKAVQCSYCHSIWTPGTLVWAYRVRLPEGSTTGDNGLRSTGAEVPLNVCPGCGLEEGK